MRGRVKIIVEESACVLCGGISVIKMKHLIQFIQGTASDATIIDEG